MVLRSKMLGIAAWGLFLFVPLVQGLNINSSVVPLGFSSPVTVELSYQSGEELLPPLCGNNIRLAPSNITVDLNSPERQLVPAAKLQTPPRVVVTGLSDSDSYTYVFGDVSALQAFFGTRDKPFISHMRVNIAGNDFSSGVVLDPYLAPIPEWGYTAELHILIFRQPSVLSDYSLEEYVNTACGVGLRCAFDIRKFVEDKRLSLVYAGGFEVSQDEASLVAVSALVGEVFACNRLVLYRLSQNPLIGDAELKVNIQARFETEEVVTKPLCGRVFHYMEDDLVVASNNSKAIPGRKLRSIPSISLEMKSLPIRPGQETSQQNSSASGNRTADQQDVLFTLVLVQHREGADMERPLVNWVITNIKNFDISTGDCSVPYQAMLLEVGKRNANFLLYKQSRRIKIQAGDYAADGYCPLLFRCGWDMKKLVQENDLELVGALSYFVEADPYTVTERVEAKMTDAEEGCTRLAAYKHEGRMLGQCLQKFDAWKALKQELEKSVVEFKKKMIMKQMSMMCPELGSHFSEEKRKSGGERREEDKEYGIMGDKGKEEMEMMVKIFIMKAMKKVEKLKEMKGDGNRKEPGSDVMKPDYEMIGPHCVQVVMKYIYKKMELMKEQDRNSQKDDEMDGKEGGNCLEAAKKFMKEMWETRQKDKSMEGGDNLERIVKEMWKNKRMGEREESKSREMWENVMGMQQERNDAMNQWQGKMGKDEPGPIVHWIRDVKQKIMKETLKKVYGMLFGGDEDQEKVSAEEFKAKWSRFQNWKKKAYEDEENKEMQNWLMEIKKKMMMEKMKKVMAMLREQEMDQWKKIEEREGREREKEGMIQEIKKKMMMKVFQFLLEHGEMEEHRDEELKEMKEKVMGFIKMMVMAKKQFEDKMEEMKKKMMMIKLFEKLLSGGVDEEECSRDENIKEMKEKVTKVFKMLMRENNEEQEKREILEMINKFRIFEKEGDKKGKEEKFFELSKKFQGVKEGDEDSFESDGEETQKIKKLFEMLKSIKEEKEGKEGGFGKDEGKGEKMKKIFEMIKKFKGEKEGDEGSFDNDGDEAQKIKKLFEMFKSIKKEKEEKEGGFGKDEGEGIKTKKMFEMIKKFKGEKEGDEGSFDNDGEEAQKMKKLFEMLKSIKEEKEGKEGGFGKDEGKREKMKKIFEMIKKFKGEKQGDEGSFDNDGEEAQKIKKLFEIFRIIKEVKEMKEGGFGNDVGEGKKMKKIFEMIKKIKGEKEGDEGSFDKDGEEAQKIKKIFEMFKSIKEEKEGKQGGFGKDEGKGEKMKKIFEMIKKFKGEKQGDKGSFDNDGDEAQKMKKLFEMFKSIKEVKEGKDGGFGKDEVKGEKMKKMFEMIKKFKGEKQGDKGSFDNDGDEAQKIKKLFEIFRIIKEVKEMKEGGFGNDVGEGKKMKKMFEMIKKIKGEKEGDEGSFGNDGDETQKIKKIFEMFKSIKEEKEGKQGGFGKDEGKGEKMKKIFEMIKKFKGEKQGDKGSFDNDGDEAQKIKKLFEMFKSIKEVKERKDGGFGKDEGEGEKMKKIFEMIKKFKGEKEGDEESFDNDGEEAQKIKKLFEIFQTVKEEKEGKEGGFGKDEGEWEKMKNIFEIIKILKTMNEEKEGSFEEDGEKGEKMKRIYKFFKFFKEEKEGRSDGRFEKDGEEGEKMKKIFQVMKMLEFAKKWGEDAEALEQEDKKAKKMAFLVHAFKAFLTKHMAMKEKLEMFEEFFKKKMMSEKRCPVTDEVTGGDYEKHEEKSKCMMLLKEVKMKEKIKEILEDNMSDMKAEPNPKQPKGMGDYIKQVMKGMMKRAKDEM